MYIGSCLTRLEKIAGAQKLTELFRDARRFILSHARAIEVAPLYAYASALMFSPEQSLTRELFKKEEPGWMVLKLRMEVDRNACLQTLEDHNGGVTSVAFSADGQRLHLAHIMTQSRSRTQPRAHTRRCLRSTTVG
jgi:hypothetical protein